MKERTYINPHKIVNTGLDKRYIQQRGDYLPDFLLAAEFSATH